MTNDELKKNSRKINEINEKFEIFTKNISFPEYFIFGENIFYKVRSSQNAFRITSCPVEFKILFYLINKFV